MKEQSAWGHRETVNPIGGEWKAWNSAQPPSKRAKSIIEELNKQGRDIFDLKGPSVEYRSGIWLDLSFFLSNGAKHNWEIDDEHHDDLIQQLKDAARDTALQEKGWHIHRLHWRYVDSRTLAEIATEILNQVFALENSISSPVNPVALMKENDE